MKHRGASGVARGLPRTTFSFFGCQTGLGKAARLRSLTQRLAQDGVPFWRALGVTTVHNHKLARSSFTHQSLELGVKDHRRLIGVDGRLK